MTLKEFFTVHNKIALGFSGGVDSSFLLYSAIKYGADIKPYFIKTAFQPEFELEDAMKLASQLNIEPEIIRVDVLQNEKVTENPKNRCYFCKNTLFSILREEANAEGRTLIDGTNYSDDAGDRPGMKALKEMNVLSPLRECKLTKAEIRKLSKDAGLFTWDKPAYACLATRIPTGTTITAENLEKAEKAEGAVAKLGFKDFRVRIIGNTGKLQVKPEQMQKAIELRKEILEALLKLKIEPFEDLGFAKIDHHRQLRQGIGEVVYGASKTPEQIVEITNSLLNNGQETVLITRMNKEAKEYAQGKMPFEYYEMPKLAIAGKIPKPTGNGKIVIVTGGTSDMPVAEEAALTAEALGNKVVRIYDAGVAGIHRLLSHTQDIMSAKVIVAIAGMEGALASVVGGMADCPVIAVPTSVGYGAAFGGLAALLSMLNSCASGVSVVNIDNGFGAGYLASMINKIGEN